MREPANLHCYDVGIFGRIPEPQNQYYLSLETPRHLKQLKKIPWVFRNMVFINLIFLEIENVVNVGRGEHRKSRRPV